MLLDTSMIKDWSEVWFGGMPDFWMKIIHLWIDKAT